MTTLFRLIAGFFKAIGHFLSFLRSLIFNLLFLVVVVVIIYALWGTEETFLKEETILKLSIIGNIVEQPSQRDPFSG
ncbi:MAG: hypothetical protein ACR2PB_13255, partial [Desulfocapsaceae bacterium]